MGEQLIAETLSRPPATLTDRETLALAAFAVAADDMTRTCAPDLSPGSQFFQWLRIPAGHQQEVIQALIDKKVLEVVRDAGPYSAAVYRIPPLTGP
ncbi:hypothetical protein ACFFMN_23665 [Planobispora siamensis]|uniref:Uncharacterized protein n=1 Tax=Planobispora siamensis TaxID=936338 RepID=A0A8J3SJ62_9ACTN|nr:hypothetical protein [Planobispora siamensis]GIH95363.1 hypothetical protein Psi01_59930 [Planobispora siamensis]